MPDAIECTFIDCCQKRHLPSKRTKPTIKDLYTSRPSSPFPSTQYSAPSSSGRSSSRPSKRKKIMTSIKSYFRIQRNPYPDPSPDPNEIRIAKRISELECRHQIRAIELKEGYDARRNPKAKDRKPHLQHLRVIGESPYEGDACDDVAVVDCAYSRRKDGEDGEAKDEVEEETIKRDSGHCEMRNTVSQGCEEAE